MSSVRFNTPFENIPFIFLDEIIYAKVIYIENVTFGYAVFPVKNNVLWSKIKMSRYNFYVDKCHECSRTCHAIKSFIGEGESPSIREVERPSYRAH